MNRILQTVVWVWAAAGALAASGAAPGPEAALSTNVCRIGDPVRLTVRVPHAPGAKVELPPLARDRALVVRDQRQSTAPAGTGAVTTLEVDLASFVVGSHTVTTGGVRVREGTNEFLRALPELTLRVDSVLQGTNEPPRALRPPVAWPWRIPWLAIGIGLAVALAAAGVVVWLVLRRPRPPAPPPVPPEPAHARALRALKALKARGWIEQGEAEPFYVELSAIVRAYLEGRFGLHAPERTTEEFIREAATSRVLSAPHQALTCAFLEQADLVKFARHRPGAADRTAAWDAAERLVLETVPAPPPAGGGAA